LPWIRSKRAGLSCPGCATGQPYRYAGNVAQRKSPRPKASCTIARASFMAPLGCSFSLNKNPIFRLRSVQCLIRCADTDSSIVSVDALLHADSTISFLRFCSSLPVAFLRPNALSSYTLIEANLQAPVSGTFLPLVLALLCIGLGSCVRWNTRRAETETINLSRFCVRD